MLTTSLLLIIGLVLLVKGADWLVKGASVLAGKFGISDLAVGLTVVAFGTSAPELIVNTFAAYQGHDAIVFGNIIGSNNFNLFVILGISGLIAPLAVQSSTIWKEIPLSLIAGILLYLLCNDLFSDEKILNRTDGLILLVFFGGFLFYVYKQLKNDPKISLNAKNTTLSGYKIWGLIFIGLSGLVIGGRMVITNAIEIAERSGLSEEIIGLTLVAAGTSLPELATSVIAAIKKKTDIAVGNVIGSNIFNILFILSVSSLVSPVSYDPSFNLNMYLLAGGTIFLFAAMFTGGNKKLDRWEAGLLLGFYVIFVVFLIINL